MDGPEYEAFGQLKNALTSAPILGFPREDGLWYLDTDASDVGTGAVLSQVQDEEERVIAFVSKSLEGSEQRYCTARKELLAVVRALKHFKCYLYGQKITVRTDNSAVSWLHRSKDPVGQPAMAPVGASVLGERGTTPTVPRVGRTGMEAPASRPGGSTRRSAPAVPWRKDRSPSRHGTHPGAARARFLLARNASRREPDLQRVQLCNVEET